MSDGALFVALPAEDDPIHKLLSVPDAHITLTYFGDASDIDERDPEHLLRLLDVGEAVSLLHDPFVVSVNGRAELGDEGARVLLVESDDVVNLYQRVKESWPVTQLLAEFPDSHPWWIPHMTYAYDEVSEPFDAPDTIRIDRLALWWGDDRETWPLNRLNEPVYPQAVPTVWTSDDLPAAIEVASANPSGRWYVQRRAHALGLSHTLPEWVP